MNPISPIFDALETTWEEIVRLFNAVPPLTESRAAGVLRAALLLKYFFINFVNSQPILTK